MSYKVIVDSCGELTPEMKNFGKDFYSSADIECRRTSCRR